MNGQADLSDSFISHREHTRVTGVGENNLSAADMSGAWKDTLHRRHRRRLTREP